MDANTFVSQFNNPVKFGRLKYINVNCRDLDQDLTRKVLGKLKGRLEINWYPDLKDYDLLLMTQDRGPFTRRLCKIAREQGVTSVVVQHGTTAHKHAFVPLMADYLICWKEEIPKFIEWGVDKDRLITSNEEIPEDLKYIPGLDAVMFLTPPAEKGNPRHYYNGHYPFYSARQLNEYIHQVKAAEPGLIVKPHHRGVEYMKRYLKGVELTFERAENLIHSASRIYSFKDCTTVKDTRVMGKTPRVIEDIYGAKGT